MLVKALDHAFVDVVIEVTLGGELVGSRRSHSMLAPLFPTADYNTQKWTLPLSGRRVVHHDRRTAIYQLC